MAIKTNERPGTRAVLRHAHLSSYKAREVLDLVRGQSFSRAVELLDHTDRGAAPVVAKLLRSAAANAEHNEGLDPAELYVASAYADEGTTMKRWRPRARGRATRIRKRTCHITVILSRMPDEQILRLRRRAEAEAAERRARRVAGTRRRRGEEATSEEAPAATAAGRRRRGESDARAAAAAEVEHEAVVEQVALDASGEEPELEPAAPEGEPELDAAAEAAELEPAAADDTTDAHDSSAGEPGTDEAGRPGEDS
jgi:large subunit ribosomal protein L22